MKTYVKKQGRQGTVYLDDGRSLPIANMEDQPMGFPFTARMEEIVARFGSDLVIIEDKTPEKVSGVIVSDEQVLSAYPGSEQHMKESPLPISESAMFSTSPKLGPIVFSPTANATPIEALTLDTFRDYMRRYHYARGKEKRELGRDLEAVASFLIEVYPPIEGELAAIKEEETSERKRFTL